ncbi:preprotein translocase subunit SecA [Chryseobacterium sp. 6424]|uniref:YchJ family protein n=1 Tax=Chryseobacterium sp. 6424 TaxID=2039166 RepID=UPI000EFC9048|nr:YchJ family protein [Chryseobacterium sp. 6424]AYO58267.1 preprotein translocase subunit SecA [Chryseobacterium sp. 6424]
MICPCCSAKDYNECCYLYHSGEENAPTAEALMRSRYAAFALKNADYLYNTTLPGKRKFHPKKELQEWAEINIWTKLEILRTPALDVVEFRAYYTDDEGQPQIHHELSRFRKAKGCWYYVSGDFL